VTGAEFPIQIVNNRELLSEDNIWLKGLDVKLDVERMHELFLEIDRQDKATELGAYINTIFEANAETVEEGSSMDTFAKTVNRTFKTAGIITRTREEGRKEGKIEGRGEGRLEGKEEDARNALNLGLSVDMVQKITGLDKKKIKAIAAERE
jgi:predicted transposase/invertase (TIGR01784 family)